MRLSPETLAKWKGFVTSDGLRGGFCSGDRPICVEGHYAKIGERVLTEALRSCTHRTSDHHAVCGTRLYIARMQYGGSARIENAGEPIWFVVEVTEEHVRKMHREPMIFLEKMEIISCVIPHADLTLARLREKQ